MAHRLIPLTPPLFFHFTLPLKYLISLMPIQDPGFGMERVGSRIRDPG
jgi:hypothetical protein